MLNSHLLGTPSGGFSCRASGERKLQCLYLCTRASLYKAGRGQAGHSPCKDISCNHIQKKKKDFLVSVFGIFRGSIEARKHIKKKTERDSIFIHVDGETCTAELSALRFCSHTLSS